MQTACSSRKTIKFLRFENLVLLSQAAKKEPAHLCQFLFYCHQSPTTLSFAFAGFKITSATQSLMRSSASLIPMKLRFMAVNISSRGHVRMPEAVADAHAVNPVKEQHTRLRVTERMRIDMRKC